MNIGEQIDALYELRSMRRDFEAQVEELKSQEKQIEQDLIDQTQELGVTSLKGNLAMFSTKAEVLPVVKDWDAIYAFILDNLAFDLLHKRLSTTTWRELHEEGIILPGTEEFFQIKASLRKL
jgi:hypothetical protein